MNAVEPDTIWAANKNSKSWFDIHVQQAQLKNICYSEHIHEVYFKAKGTPTVDDIKKQFELISMQPGEPGDGIETISGTPNKTDLLNDSKLMTTTQALCEFLDNIFDNYLEHHEELDDVRKNKDLSVRMLFNDIDIEEVDTQNNGMFLISENSGGISREKWSPLIKMGYSKNSPDKESVGTWGRGSKLALASCGRWNRVQTQHISQPSKKNAQKTSTIQISFGGEKSIDNPDGELTEEQKKKEHNYYHRLNSYWDIQAKESTSGWCVDEGPGTTCITIRRLTEKFMNDITNSEKYEAMVKKLDEIFSYKINQLAKLGGEIEILLENTTLPESNEYRKVYLSKLDETPIVFKGDINEYKKLFSYIPNFEPIHLNCSWESKEVINGKEVINHLNAEIFLGSPLINTSPYQGLNIWGNGRLFEKNMKKNFEVPQSDGYAKWDDGETPQNSRVFGLIFLTSKKSFLIPWQGPVKWGWEENSDFSEAVMKLVGNLITRFTNFSHYLTHTGTAPGDGTNRLTDLYQYTEKDGDPPQKFTIDCSSEEKRELDLDNALAAITGLSDSEVRQYISHHQEYSSNREVADSTGVSLKQTKTSLKEFIDILEYRKPSKYQLDGQNWYKEELLTNAQSLALFLSPDAFLEYKNEFGKYTKKQLKEWLKNNNVDFKSSGATKDYLLTKILESLQEEE